MDLRVGLWRRLSAEELMLLNCGVEEDSWESLALQGDPTSSFWRQSALGFLWKEWCWSWNSSTLATSCEELTHWKRLWCWEGLKAGGEGDDRGWDGWMASPTQWTWVWVNSRSWDGQGGLTCCSSWGHKELDMTERLNNNSFSSQLLHIIPLNSSSPGRKVSILQRGWEVLVAMYLLQTQDMGSSPHVYTVTSGHYELRHWPHGPRLPRLYNKETRTLGNPLN